MKTGPRLAALFALLVSWLNSRLDSLVVAMKAVLNVETYLHCSQDLRGTQHGLWPGLSPNLHLSDYGRVARHPPAIGGKRHAMPRLLLKGRMSRKVKKNSHNSLPC